jgi:hypothetical protein
MIFKTRPKRKPLALSPELEERRQEWDTRCVTHNQKVIIYCCVTLLFVLLTISCLAFYYAIVEEGQPIVEALKNAWYIFCCMFFFIMFMGICYPIWMAFPFGSSLFISLWFFFCANKTKIAKETGFVCPSCQYSLEHITNWRYDPIDHCIKCKQVVATEITYNSLYNQHYAFCEQAVDDFSLNIFSPQRWTVLLSILSFPLFVTSLVLGISGVIGYFFPHYLKGLKPVSPDIFLSALCFVVLLYALLHLTSRNLHLYFSKVNKNAENA